MTTAALRFEDVFTNHSASPLFMGVTLVLDEEFCHRYYNAHVPQNYRRDDPFRQQVCGRTAWEVTWCQVMLRLPRLIQAIPQIEVVAQAWMKDRKTSINMHTVDEHDRILTSQMIAGEDFKTVRDLRMSLAWDALTEIGTIHFHALERPRAG